MASRFVRPEVVTIPISNGDTITVRKRLNAGEQRAMFARMSNDDGFMVNRLKVGLAQISAYLLDWTLRDDEGNLVPVADRSVEEIEAHVNALDVDSFREIREAIEKHIETQNDQREKEKNDQAGESPSLATSPLLDSVGGHSAKFVN